MYQEREEKRMNIFTYLHGETQALDNCLET
jgi:hypothetical protein